MEKQIVAYECIKEYPGGPIRGSNVAAGVLFENLSRGRDWPEFFRPVYREEHELYTKLVKLRAEVKTIENKLIEEYGPGALLGEPCATLQGQGMVDNTIKAPKPGEWVRITGNQEPPTHMAGIEALPYQDTAVTGIDIAREERMRQIREEGFTPEKDDDYDNDELARAAMVYANPFPDRFFIKKHWPWDMKWYKPDKTDTPDGRIRELAKASALLMAEIDRILREARNAFSKAVKKAGAPQAGTLVVDVEGFTDPFKGYKEEDVKAMKEEIATRNNFPSWEALKECMTHPDEYAVFIKGVQSLLIGLEPIVKEMDTFDEKEARKTWENPFAGFAEEAVEEAKLYVALLHLFKDWDSLVKQFGSNEQSMLDVTQEVLGILHGSPGTAAYADFLTWKKGREERKLS